MNFVKQFAINSDVSISLNESAFVLTAENDQNVFIYSCQIVLNISQAITQLTLIANLSVNLTVNSTVLFANVSAS